MRGEYLFSSHIPLYCRNIPVVKPSTLSVGTLRLLNLPLNGGNSPVTFIL